MPATNPDDPGRICPAERLSAAVAKSKVDTAEGLAEVDGLLRDYPRDATLHFLRGSMLAGLQQYRFAREAMAIALTIAPDYALARFQLGLLELTSGDAGAADVTWRPLDGLGVQNPLRQFAQGLRNLALDRFEEAVAELKAGLSQNADIPPLNADMTMVIEAIEARQSGAGPSEPVTASHLLLQRYAGKTTLH